MGQYLMSYIEWPVPLIVLTTPYDQNDTICAKLNLFRDLGSIGSIITRTWLGQSLKQWHADFWQPSWQSTVGICAKREAKYRICFQS